MLMTQQLDELKSQKATMERDLAYVAKAIDFLEDLTEKAEDASKGRKRTVHTFTKEHREKMSLARKAYWDRVKAEKLTAIGQTVETPELVGVN